LTPSEREEWERSWTERTSADFSWHRSHIEPQLVDLVESLTGPPGVALDIGCGSGTVTRFLAGRFRLTIGLDHAVAAVARAVATPADTAVYGVSDAGALPIADGAIALVVDRSCSHVLPDHQMRPFLDEVARVLEPGGRYAVVARVHSATRRTPSAVRRLREIKLRVAARRRGERTLTARRLRARLPPSLSLGRVTHIRQQSEAGLHQHHLYAVAIRR
jgi:SAM-dependent methyltransferase